MVPCAQQPQLPTAPPFHTFRQAGRRVIPLPRLHRRSRRTIATMASASGSPNPVVLGCGGISVDYLAAVASFPNPDDKIRSLALKVQGGGNTGNALTAAARLGLRPRIISKVANDAQGRSILSELQTDGVDTSYILVRITIPQRFSDSHSGAKIVVLKNAASIHFFSQVAENGNSPFTYIIVDEQTKTRTCIHTPGSPPMVPEELTKANLSSALDGVDIVYFDVRLHDIALLVAEEASQRKIPILIDAERKREGLDELLNFASYVVCSAKFPQAWTGASSIPVALVSMLSRLPNIKFVIVTLGEKGCLMLERSSTDASEAGEIDAEALFESLEKSIDQSSTIPKCVASKSNLRISADGVSSISGRLLLGTAEVIPPGELVDTTGAGDAFIGAVLYGQCAMFPFPRHILLQKLVYAPACHRRGCYLLLHEWLVVVAEVWGLEPAFPIAQTHAWLAIDPNSEGLHPP
ncbi:pfkB-like carbohydrate kinase family protein [Zea mays]|uniref:PfkB-like carbohydrate kinase family protein n=1 Tax=Zea mays TaxID=4577 RepID=A0A1D6KIN1_MAIZE|nr:pfkB-like carbohydrate kinase family protein [Zea mays]